MYNMNCSVVLNDCNYDNLPNSSQYFTKYTNFNFDCFVDMTSVNVADCTFKQNNQMEVVETAMTKFDEVDGGSSGSDGSQDQGK